MNFRLTAAAAAVALAANGLAACSTGSTGDQHGDGDFIHDGAARVAEHEIPSRQPRIMR